MRYQEFIRFLKIWTLPRLWNALLLGVSYFFAKHFKIIKPLGLPTSISIEPTTACNLGCPECPSGLKKFTRPTGNLKIDQLESWLSQMKNHLTYINFYFQGEPFIHPKFLDQIKLAKSLNFYTSTSTNAHFLNDDMAKKTVESGLDRLIISIDGTTQEVYEQYRVSGDLNKVLDGADNIIKWKKALKSSTPYVIFQFLVVQPNEHQIEEVKILAQKIGVDELKFKTAQVYEPKDNHPLIPKNAKYSRYKKTSNGDYVLKNEMKNNCLRLWTGSVLTWDGKVVPCCFDKDALHVLGNLTTQTFREVWISSQYQSFRKQVFTNRKSVDICSNCSEGTQVWV